MDSLAHVQAVTLPIVPPHPRPDAKNLGGEVSFEPPSHHSIISSARASSASGNERLSSFAVLRLMISSIFVDWRNSKLAINVDKAGPIAEKAARHRELAMCRDRRQRITQHQRRQLLAAAARRDTSQPLQPARRRLRRLRGPRRRPTSAPQSCRGFISGPSRGRGGGDLGSPRPRQRFGFGAEGADGRKTLRHRPGW